MRLSLDHFDSPVGTVLLVHDAEGCLRALDFHDYADRMNLLLRRHYGIVELIEGRAPEHILAPLRDYFGGKIDALAPVPVATGGTAFQSLVWSHLLQIPPGATICYGELAARIGNPAASRAVGLANGANPVAIVVPCHRVIGANGSLTGFGGGLQRKRWLLDHESALPQGLQAELLL